MKANNSNIKSSEAKKSLTSILEKLAKEKMAVEKKILASDYTGLKKKHKLVQPVDISKDEYLKAQ